MTWIKLDDGFPNHPKVHAVGDEAAWLFVAGLCYCSSYLTDGFIPAAALGRLTGQSDPAELVARLVDVGMWEIVPGGWQVRDYTSHQRSKAEVEVEREKGKERAARSREVRANRERTQGARSPEVREPDTEVDTETPLVGQIVDAVFAAVLGEKQQAGGITSVDGFRKWWDKNDGPAVRDRAVWVVENYELLNVSQYRDVVRSPKVPHWAASMRRKSA